MILGIDEVGRGPWAGPLVVGAVVLGGAAIDGLDDSKKLTKKRREVLAQLIQEQAAAYALGWVSAAELDDVGMSEALRLATRRAVEAVQQQCREQAIALTEIVIDGRVNFLAGTALERYVTMLPKADALVPSVSAASIIAKVARDQYMAAQDVLYPGYGFAAHAGYGTAQHRAAIVTHGVTLLHRLSFKPLQHYRNDDPPQQTKRILLSNPTQRLHVAMLANQLQPPLCGSAATRLWRATGERNIVRLILFRNVETHYTLLR